MTVRRTMNAEYVVHDEQEPCPYRPYELARMPLKFRVSPLSRRELDEKLELGERRCGPFMYRPACPSCTACEPIRIDVERFQPNRTQRRTWRRGAEELDIRVARPSVDARRLALFNRHRLERGLAQGVDYVDAEHYRMFLVESCCDSWELSYYDGDDLLAVAIIDRGYNSLSAMYCYYDPAEARRSLGAFSILREIELCKTWEIQYLYLGYYVDDCEHMNYKSRYKPHQRLVGAQWQEFGRRE